MPPEKGTMPSHHSACGDAVLLRIVHCSQGTPTAFGDNRSRHCPRCEQVPRDCQSGAFGKPPVSKEDRGRCHVPKRAQAARPDRRESGALSGPRRCRTPTLPSPKCCRARGITAPVALPRPNAAAPGTLLRPDVTEPHSQRYRARNITAPRRRSSYSSYSPYTLSSAV